VDLQHINAINVSTRSRCQSGQSVEMTTTRMGHGSAQTVSVSSQPEIGVLYGSSAYTMHKRTPTHGSGGEWSISTKRSRSRSIAKSTIVILLSLSEHIGLGACINEGEQAAVELVYRLGAGSGGDILET